jgi:hypothetical protein
MTGFWIFLGSLAACALLDWLGRGDPEPQGAADAIQQEVAPDGL